MFGTGKPGKHCLAIFGLSWPSNMLESADSLLELF